MQKSKFQMPSDNLKFKIILCFLLLLLFSGCANNANTNSNNSIGTNAQASKKIIPANKERSEIKILFVGDMMFDRYIRQVVERHGGDYGYPLSPVKNYLEQFDLVVGNLEGPITNHGSTSVDSRMGEKSNFVFTFDPKTAEALAENNVKLVSLGNNHILNQDESGAGETKKYLDAAGIAYFGDTGTEDKEFTVKNVAGTKIAFVNYNYSIAGSEEKALEDIRIAKAQSDIVIFCPHWGTEFKTGDPGKRVRSLAHRFIEAGADAIVGTHPHVIEDEEEYQNKRIYYSLGNFLFDQYFQKETMEGLGTVLTIQPNLVMEYDEVRFEMKRNGQTELK